MTKQQQEQLKIELNQAQTLAQFFEIVNKYYDTKNCVLGVGAKTSLLLYLPQLVTLTNVKSKN
jgi:hypothetical protein